MGLGNHFYLEFERWFHGLLPVERSQTPAILIVCVGVFVFWACQALVATAAFPALSVRLGLCPSSESRVWNLARFR